MTPALRAQLARELAAADEVSVATRRIRAVAGAKAQPWLAQAARHGADFDDALAGLDRLGVPDDLLDRFAGAVEAQTSATAASLDLLGEHRPVVELGFADLRRQVEELAERINPGCGLAFAAEVFADGNAVVRSGAPTGERRAVAGLYERALNLARIALDPTRFDVLNSGYHELWHSLERLFTSDERAVLRREFPANGRVSAEERAAYAFARWATRRHRFGADVDGPFGKVRNFLWRFGHYLQGNGFHTPEDIFHQAWKGAIARRHPRHAASLGVEPEPVRPHSVDMVKGRYRAAAVREAGDHLHGLVIDPTGQDAVRLDGLRAAVALYEQLDGIADGRLAGAGAIQGPALDGGAAAAALRALVDCQPVAPASLAVLRADTAPALCALAHLELLGKAAEWLEGNPGRADIAGTVLAVAGDPAWQHVTDPALRREQQRHALGPLSAVWQDQDSAYALAEPVPDFGRLLAERLSAADAGGDSEVQVLDERSVTGVIVEARAGDRAVGWMELRPHRRDPAILQVRGVDLPAERGGEVALAMFAHLLRHGERVVPGLFDQAEAWETVLPELDFERFWDDAAYRAAVERAFGVPAPSGPLQPGSPLPAEVDSEGRWRPEMMRLSAESAGRILSEAPVVGVDGFRAFGGTACLPAVAEMYGALYRLGHDPLSPPVVRRLAREAGQTFHGATGGMWPMGAAEALAEAIDGLPLSHRSRQRLHGEVAPIALAADHAHRMAQVLDWAEANPDHRRLYEACRGMVALAGDPSRPAGNRDPELGFQRDRAFLDLVAGLGLLEEDGVEPAGEEVPFGLPRDRETVAYSLGAKGLPLGEPVLPSRCPEVLPPVGAEDDHGFIGLHPALAGVVLPENEALREDFRQTLLGQGEKSDFLVVDALLRADGTWQDGTSCPMDIGNGVHFYPILALTAKNPDNIFAHESLHSDVREGKLGHDDLVGFDEPLLAALRHRYRIGEHYEPRWHDEESVAHLVGEWVGGWTDPGGPPPDDAIPATAAADDLAAARARLAESLPLDRATVGFLDACARGEISRRDSRPAVLQEALRELGYKGADDPRIFRFALGEEATSAAASPKVVNHVITDPAALGGGGPVSRFRRNVEAIRLLKALQTDQRPPTAEEARMLAGYTGFGGIAELAFGHHGGRDPNLRVLRQDLDGLLTPEERQSLLRSTPNSHYTDGLVAAALWQGLAHLGLEKGRVLEPAAGPGWFLGLQPDSLRRSVSVAAVEMDHIAGTIARLLYPRSPVQILPFEEAALPDGFFDAVLGNVPFGRYGVADRRYSHLAPSLHDYFLLRSVDLTRPGGIVAVLTSHWSLDKQDPAIREALRDKAELVAAIRLPTGAHRKTAATEVVTDVLVLRKRATPLSQMPPEMARRVIGQEHDWMALTRIPDPLGGRPLRVNSYFTRHPDHVIGRLERSGKINADGGEKSLAVMFDPPGDFHAAVAERLGTILGSLPKGLLRRRSGPSLPQAGACPPEVKRGAWFLMEGRLYRNIDGAAIAPQPPLAARQEAIVRDALSLRDALRTCLSRQQEARPAAEREAARHALSGAYEAFSTRHGSLRERRVRDILSGDPDWPLLQALETPEGSKARIFIEDVLKPAERPQRVQEPGDALAISLGETGRIDLDAIGRLLGLSRVEARKTLLAAGLAFADPARNAALVPPDAYLSGNVREKLTLARAAAAIDPAYRANVTALQEVQPVWIPWQDIHVRLGAVWVPQADARQFLSALFHLPEKRIRLDYNSAQHGWQIRIDGTSSDRVKALRRLAENAFNGRSTVVRDDEGRVDAAATAAAAERTAELQAKFAEWLWADAERRSRLEERYNALFNTERPRRWDGSHLAFPDMTAEWRAFLRPTQRNAVWRGIQSNMIANHEVGAGKTVTAIAMALEGVRLGRYRKPVLAVHRPTLWQGEDSFGTMIPRLYPGARALIWPNKETVTAEERRAFFARAATGDWDLIVVPHEAFDLLPVTPETERRHLQQQLGEWQTALQEAARAERERGSKKRSTTVKAIQQKVAQLETRLQTLLNTRRKDDTVCWEDLGANALLIDEAHKYKNLYVATGMDQVRGMPSGESQRAAHLHMVTSLLNEQQGRVVALTGTGIANSLAELYNWQRYLQPDELRRRGISCFDAWASVFAVPETRLEIGVAGQVRRTARLSRYVNLPELKGLTDQVFDVVFTEDIPGIRRPQVTRSVVMAPPSAGQRAFMADLAARVRDLKRGAPDLRDNMLKIATDGRKAALDLRLVVPEGLGGKMDDAVANILRIWREQPKATQLVFFDLGAGPTLENPDFVFRDELKRRLVDAGVAPEQIADFFDVGRTLPELIRARLLGAGFAAEQLRDLYGEADDTEAGFPQGIRPAAEWLRHHLGVPLDAGAALVRDCQREQALQKQRKAVLQQRLRDGHARIGIGSTGRMGTGINVQDRVVAEHHLDCPMVPASLGQRRGRMHRHGNLNPSAYSYHYITEGSFDAFTWQLVEAKERFIHQFLRPDGTVPRSMADQDVEELSPASLMAIATGNPLLLLKAQLGEEIQAAELAERRQIRDRQTSADTARSLERDIARLDEERARCRPVAAAARLALSQDGGGPREATGRLVHQAWQSEREARQQGHSWSRPEVPLGSWRGVPLLIKAGDRYSEPVVVLRLPGGGASGAAGLSNTQEAGSAVGGPAGGDLAVQVNPASPLGTVMSMDAQLRKAVERPGQIEGHLAELRVDLAAARTAATRPIAPPADLSDKRRQLRRVEAMLATESAMTDGGLAARAARLVADPDLPEWQGDVPRLERAQRRLDAALDQGGADVTLWALVARDLASSERPDVPPPVFPAPGASAGLPDLPPFTGDGPADPVIPDAVRQAVREAETTRMLGDLAAEGPREHWPAHLARLAPDDLPRATALDLAAMLVLGPPTGMPAALDGAQLRAEVRRRGAALIADLGWPADPDSLYRSRADGLERTLGDITAGRRWDLAVAHYTPARGLNRARRTWLVERLRDAVMLNDGDRTAMMAELMPLAREFETSFGRLEDHLPSLVVASVPGSLWQRVTGRSPPDWAADAARALRQPLSGWKPARVVLGAQGQDGYRGAGPVVISGDERRWRIWHEPSGRELTSSLLPIRHLATACAEAEAWAQGMNWQAADVDRQITNLRLRLAAARAEGSREAYRAVLREGQPALSLGREVVLAADLEEGRYRCEAVRDAADTLRRGIARRLERVGELFGDDDLVNRLQAMHGLVAGVAELYQALDRVSRAPGLARVRFEARHGLEAGIDAILSEWAFQWIEPARSPDRAMRGLLEDIRRSFPEGDIPWALSDIAHMRGISPLFGPILSLDGLVQALDHLGQDVNDLDQARELAGMVLEAVGNPGASEPVGAMPYLAEVAASRVAQRRREEQRAKATDARGIGQGRADWREDRRDPEPSFALAEPGAAPGSTAATRAVITSDPRLRFASLTQWLDGWQQLKGRRPISVPAQADHIADLPAAMIAGETDVSLLREVRQLLITLRPPHGARADHPATTRIEAINTRLAELGAPAPDLEKSSFRLARLATGRLTGEEAARGERLAREGEEPWRPLFRREAVLALRRLAQVVGGTVSRQHDGATLKTPSVTVFAIASEVGGQVVCVPHAAPGAARRVPTHTTDLDALADVRDFAARLQRLGLIEAPGERPSPTASATAEMTEKPTPEGISPAYTGIGARATPPAVLTVMEEAGERLARTGWVLRSGAASGADTAFEAGCDRAKGPKQIVLPWRGFNGRTSSYQRVTPAMLDIAARYHPAWDKCSPGARKLHARNVPQVLGPDLQTPSALVICWTPGGDMVGGTGQALRIAQDQGVAVLNLGDPRHASMSAADIEAYAQAVFAARQAENRDREAASAVVEETPEAQALEPQNRETAVSADLPPWQMTRHEFERRNIRHGGVMAVPLAFSRAFGAAPEALPLPGDTGRFGVAPPLFGDSSVRYMLQDGSIWQYRGIGATPVDNAGRVRGWEDVTREVLQSHRHREAVVTALDAGLPVLVDYPDLASGRLVSTADGERGRLSGVGDGQVFLDDGTPVTVLVITQCTRSKGLEPASAEELYTGRHHRHLMAGVAALRAAGHQVDVRIISAEHGLVDGERTVAPYDRSFATLAPAAIEGRGLALGIADALRQALADPRTALAIVAAGNDYLAAAGREPLPAAMPVIQFGGGRRLTANAVVVPLSNSDCRLLRAPQTAAKGAAAGLFLALARDRSLLAVDSAVGIRQIVLDQARQRDGQKNLSSDREQAFGLGTWAPYQADLQGDVWKPEALAGAAADAIAFMAERGRPLAAEERDALTAGAALYQTLHRIAAGEELSPARERRGAEAALARADVLNSGTPWSGPGAAARIAGTIRDMPGSEARRDRIFASLAPAMTAGYHRPFLGAVVRWIAEHGDEREAVEELAGRALEVTGDTETPVLAEHGEETRLQDDVWADLGRLRQEIATARLERSLDRPELRESTGDPLPWILPPVRDGAYALDEPAVTRWLETLAALPEGAALAEAMMPLSADTQGLGVYRRQAVTDSAAVARSLTRDPHERALLGMAAELYAAVSDIADGTVPAGFVRRRAAAAVESARAVFPEFPGQAEAPYRAAGSSPAAALHKAVFEDMPASLARRRRVWRDVAPAAAAASHAALLFESLRAMADIGDFQLFQGQARDLAGFARGVAGQSQQPLYGRQEHFDHFAADLARLLLSEKAPVFVRDWMGMVAELDHRQAISGQSFTDQGSVSRPAEAMRGAADLRFSLGGDAKISHRPIRERRAARLIGMFAALQAAGEPSWERAVKPMLDLSESLAGTQVSEELHQFQQALSALLATDHPAERAAREEALIALRGPLARATAAAVRPAAGRPQAAQPTAPQWQPVRFEALRFEPAYRIAGSRLVERAFGVWQTLPLEGEALGPFAIAKVAGRSAALAGWTVYHLPTGMVFEPAGWCAQADTARRLVERILPLHDWQGVDSSLLTGPPAPDLRQALHRSARAAALLRHGEDLHTRERLAIDQLKQLREAQRVLGEELDGLAALAFRLPEGEVDLHARPRAAWQALSRHLRQAGLLPAYPIRHGGEIKWEYRLAADQRFDRYIADVALVERPDGGYFAEVRPYAAAVARRETGRPAESLAGLPPADRAKVDRAREKSDRCDLR